jgi:hypothetical protein
MSVESRNGCWAASSWWRWYSGPSGGCAGFSPPNGTGFAIGTPKQGNNGRHQEWIAGGDNGGIASSAISAHVLPTSATMVGVCMTVIGIVKVVEGGQRETHIDEALAINSLFFLLSAVFSYLSIRTPKNTARLESLADIMFMIGLGLMSAIGIVFAFELA